MGHWTWDTGRGTQGTSMLPAMAEQGWLSRLALRAPAVRVRGRRGHGLLSGTVPCAAHRGMQRGEFLAAGRSAGCHAANAALPLPHAEITLWAPGLTWESLLLPGPVATQPDL